MRVVKKSKKKNSIYIDRIEYFFNIKKNPYTTVFFFSASCSCFSTCFASLPFFVITSAAAVFLTLLISSLGIRKMTIKIQIPAQHVKTTLRTSLKCSAGHNRSPSAPILPSHPQSTNAPMIG